MVFNYHFHFYGFFVGLGIIVGGLIVEQIKKRGFGSQLAEWSFESLLPWGLIPGIIGARLYHVLSEWDYYQQSLLKIFYVWEGGLAIYGGLAGAIFGLWLWSRSQGQNLKIFLTLLDFLSFGLPVGQAIGRLGNYFNQELYGLATNLPWAIYIEAKKGYFHPLFAYEAIWDVIIFFILLKRFSRLKKQNFSKPGSYFFIYLGLYGFGRFWLEYLRVEHWQIAGINVAQTISFLCFISLICYYMIYGRKTS